MIHRKKLTDSDLGEGSLLETASYLIEITAPTDRKIKPKKAFVKIEEETQTELPVESPGSDVKIHILYTADKIRKAKRWKDGILHWTESTNGGVFYGEENKTIFRCGC
jgi:hypothetical protein